MSADAASPSTPPSPPPRRGRWRRRVLWTFGILLLLVLLAPLALGLGPVRDLVAGKIGSALDRRVEIGSASAYWFKGIDLADVTIHSPEGFDGPLATISRVHADVDVLGLLGGSVGARVRVVQPHVTLRRDARGESNTKDLGGKEKQPEAKEEPAKLDVQLVLVAGTVEALEADGKAANALRDIQLTAALKPDGAADVDLQAAVEGAGEGGKDARLSLQLGQDAAKVGRFKVDVPPLQLSRLARLVEDTLSVSDLRGSVRIEGEGMLHADDTLSGTLTALLDGVGARTSDGTRLSIQRIQADAKLSSASGATEANVGLGLGDVRVDRKVEGRPESFREPEITLQAAGRYESAEGLLTVPSGSLRGGDLVQVLVREPLRVERDAGGRFAGRVEARVSLGRLGSLRGLFPALDPLATGTLTATCLGSGPDGKDVDVTLNVEDLALRPSDLAPNGYAEPRIVGAFKVGSEEDGGTRIQMTQFGAQLARLVPKDPERGVTLTLSPGGGYAVDGDFTLGVGLQSLSRLLGPKLGLARGESLGGTLQFVGSGVGTPEEMRLTVDVRGSSIVFPPSWGASGPPASLSAKIVTTHKGGETSVLVSDLAGLGLSGSASARLLAAKGEGDEGGLEEGEVTLTADLGQARPWIGGFLGMEPAGMLAGRLRTEMRMSAEERGKRLAGTTQVNDLALRMGAEGATMREKRVTLRADVQLAEEGGRHEARELALDTGGVRLDLAGSTFVGGPDQDLDLKAVLGGDAALLAPTLAALLGPSYADLTGSGRLSGTLKLTGSPDDHARALFTNTDLALGSWTTSGIKVENLLVRAVRGDANAPFDLQVKSSLNGGTLLATGRVTPGAEPMPWTSTVKMAGVDTSGVLLSQGAGRYLTFVLPALLPADTDVPVLSGRLDADLKGGAPALQGPALDAGLKGSGRIAMEQGEIKQSTLFGGGDRGNLGKLVSLLQVVAPEAGVVLAELQKAVTFNSLVSEFDVADRVVTVKQTKLTGRRVVVDMNGRVLFDGPIDLKSRVALQGDAGERLSKAIGQDALPLKVGGTLEEPKVEPDVDLASLIPKPGDGKDGLLDKIKKKLPDLGDLPKLPKPPKLPKLPNPFK